MENILKEFEREYIKGLSALPDGFEDSNTGNDYIAYINAYTGRAALGVFRNEREGQDFRENMVKAGGLVLAAILSYDKTHA